MPSNKVVSLLHLQYAISFMALVCDRCSQFLLLFCILQYSMHSQWPLYQLPFVMLLYSLGSILYKLLWRQNKIPFNPFYSLLVHLLLSAAWIGAAASSPSIGSWVFFALMLGFFKPETPAMFLLFLGPASRWEKPDSIRFKIALQEVTCYVTDVLTGLAIAYLLYFPHLMTLIVGTLVAFHVSVFVMGLAGYWVCTRLVRDDRTLLQTSSVSERDDAGVSKAVGLEDLTQWTLPLLEQIVIQTDAGHMGLSRAVTKSLSQLKDAFFGLMGTTCSLAVFKAFVYYSMHTYLFTSLISWFRLDAGTLPLSMLVISVLSVVVVLLGYAKMNHATAGRIWRYVSLAFFVGALLSAVFYFLWNKDVAPHSAIHALLVLAAAWVQPVPLNLMLDLCYHRQVRFY